MPPASSSPSAPFVHGGFAVLRTPLLPVDTFVRWTERVQAGAAARDPGPVLHILREVLDDPALREAIRVASRDLSSAIDAWMTGGRAVDADRLMHSVVRYFSRAAYRPTPFGLFAGCSVVGVGGHTRLELAPRGEYTRHSRIDMDHLAELARVLGEDADVRRRVPLRTNSSAAEMGGRLHYVETRYAGRMREYALTAADPTPEIRDTLARARHGSTLDALAAPLLADGYEREEVDGFLAELLDAQLLVPELGPRVTGRDAAAALAATLEAAGCAEPVSAALREVGGRLRAIDAGGVGGGADYDGAVAPLRGLAVEPDEARLLQVDLYKPAPAASIGLGVMEEAAAAVELLAGIAPRQDPLAAFAARFEARYETREVPLLEALDEEVGVGMPGVGTDDSVMRRRAEAMVQREGVLADLRCRAASGDGARVELTDEDVERLRWPGGRTLPGALAFFGSIVAESGEAVDRGDYQLALSHVSGPSGARLLGRFAHLNPELERCVQAHAAAEEALQPDALFAEIVHLPQGRIGNVIARPVLRGWEISYLGQSGAPLDRRLDLADLRVSVRRGRVRLRSASLDREVHPRLSSAHNYSAPRELPVYRFLCALQDHAQSASMHWNWGAQEGAAALPRVTRGRLILSRARWNLSAAEIRRITEAGTRWDHQAIQRWREERGLPSLVLLADSDNQLPVDFSNAVSTLAFARLLRGRAAALLTEALSGPGALCVHGPEGRFTHEIVIPLLRGAPVPPDAGAERAAYVHAPDSAEVPRAYAPGSEWVYARLYCGAGSADAVLRDLVAPVVQRAREQIPSLEWFFLRYADPGFHIRLRFRTGARAAPHLMALLGQAAAPAIASGRLSRLVYDTYLPEVERYGGPGAIRLAEAVFAVDSEAALSLVTLPAGGPPRDVIVLAGVDRMFADAGLGVDDRIAFLGRALGEVPAAVRDARAREFRPLRPAIDAVLAGELPDRVEALLAARSAAMAPLLARIRALHDDGGLHAPLDDVLVSMSHLWINRTLMDARTLEPLLYDRLRRALRGFAGRARKSGGGARAEE
ncbi:lantibiotic dehydratase [Longimicrobium terrae]|uniref:Thiopeptide-type bacteriocin biosynthesis protein n=1 Tax=Longimicrobium terrae TaxID=1639882 RepID=A0A841H0J6_9BACT|nr:lantibiotic dehydratase [Longimicrobium terrae]MBB4637134.1 thiopeptide-type bacteriocin biosynthesis protein [Longimicrobium terrae]MBB6071605.1 thiopeptide-type bacteriocin biosynthesis protein [Longimicrobium terrae]NNC29977.1 lantibiotic dehydratase [Longimicrobium terrae]